MKHILITVVLLFGIESRLCNDQEYNKAESSSAITNYNFVKEDNIQRLANHLSNYNNVQAIVKEENTLQFTNHHRNTVDPNLNIGLRENVKLQLYSPTKSARSVSSWHTRFGANPYYFIDMPNIQPYYILTPRSRLPRNSMRLSYPLYVKYPTHLQQDNQMTLLNPQNSHYKHNQENIYNQHSPINMQQAANIVNGYTDRHYNGGLHAIEDQFVGASEFFNRGRKSKAYFSQYSPPGTTGIRYNQQYFIYLPMKTVGEPGMAYQYV